MLYLHSNTRITEIMQQFSHSDEIETCHGETWVKIMRLRLVTARLESHRKKSLFLDKTIFTVTRLYSMILTRVSPLQVSISWFGHESHRDYWLVSISSECENCGMISVILVLECRYNMHAIAHNHVHARIASTFFWKVALDNKWLLWLLILWP